MQTVPWAQSVHGISAGCGCWVHWAALQLAGQLCPWRSAQLAAQLAEWAWSRRVHRGDSLAPGATARVAMGRDVLKRVTAESRWHVVCAVARLLTATPRPGLEEWGCAPGSWVPLVSGLVGVAALGLASLPRSSRIAGGGMVRGMRAAVPRPGVMFITTAGCQPLHTVIRVSSAVLVVL